MSILGAKNIEGVFNCLRFLCVCRERGYVYDLVKLERRVYSQNAEDGIIEILLELLGTDSKYCIEFETVIGINFEYAQFEGASSWNGLLLDRGHENPAINPHKKFVTAENINELFEKYEVPENLDHLSIDFDYNDFYVGEGSE